MSQFSKVLNEMQAYGVQMTDVANAIDERVLTVRRVRDEVTKEPKYSFGVKVMRLYALIDHLIERQGMKRVPLERDVDE